MRISKRLAGASWVSLLIVIAVLLICTPLVMWAVGAALGLLWLAVKICAVLLLLLCVLFFIKVMARKVNS